MGINKRTYRGVDIICEWRTDYQMVGGRRRSTKLAFPWVGPIWGSVPRPRMIPPTQGFMSRAGAFAHARAIIDRELLDAEK